MTKSLSAARKKTNAGRKARSRKKISPDCQEAYRRLGAVIREFRSRKGLTEEELAQRCGFSARRMKRIEDGEATLTLSDIEDIAEALGTVGSRLIAASDTHPAAMVERVPALPQ